MTDLEKQLQQQIEKLLPGWEYDQTVKNGVAFFRRVSDGHAVTVVVDPSPMTRKPTVSIFIRRHIPPAESGPLKGVTVTEWLTPFSPCSFEVKPGESIIECIRRALKWQLSLSERACNALREVVED